MIWKEILVKKKIVGKKKDFTIKLGLVREALTAFDSSYLKTATHLHH